MKRRISKLFICISVVLFISGCSFEDIANNYAKDIYYELDEHSYPSPKSKAALAKLNLISYLDSDAEWIQLSYSEAWLNFGYKIGDPHLEHSYVDSFLVKSHDFASKAAEGSENSQSYIQLARLQVIRGDYKPAWYTLNTAEKLDNTSFDALYLRGIISYMMNDPQRAEKNFLEAKKRIKYSYQKSRLNRYRQKVARLAKNYQKEERLLKENIQNDPESPYLYAHYGHFLEEHQRYYEAIEYFKKAVELGPYPNAVKSLKRVQDIVAR